MTMPASLIDEPDEETEVILDMMATLSEVQVLAALAYLAGDGHEVQRALIGAVDWARQHA